MFSHVKIKDVLYSNECNTVHQNVLNVKSSYYETKATYDLTQHSPLFNNNVFAGPPRHPTETALSSIGRSNKRKQVLISCLPVAQSIPSDMTENLLTLPSRKKVKQVKSAIMSGLPPLIDIYPIKQSSAAAAKATTYPLQSAGLGNEIIAPAPPNITSPQGEGGINLWEKHLQESQSYQLSQQQTLINEMKLQILEMQKQIIAMQQQQIRLENQVALLNRQKSPPEMGKCSESASSSTFNIKAERNEVISTNCSNLATIPIISTTYNNKTLELIQNVYAKIVHINKQAPSDLSCDYFLEKFLYSKAGPFSELILSHAITTAPVLIDFREGRAAKTICSEIEKHNYKMTSKTWTKLADILAVNQCWGIAQKAVTLASKYHTEYSPRVEIIEGLILYAIRHPNTEYEFLRVKNTVSEHKPVLRIVSTDVQECVKDVIHRFNDRELRRWLRHLAR